MPWVETTDSRYVAHFGQGLVGGLQLGAPRAQLVHFGWVEDVHGWEHELVPNMTTNRHVNHVVKHIPMSMHIVGEFNMSNVQT